MLLYFPASELCSVDMRAKCNHSLMCCCELHGGEVGYIRDVLSARLLFDLYLHPRNLQGVLF